MNHQDDRRSGRDPLQPSSRKKPAHEEVDEDTLRRCVAGDKRARSDLVKMYAGRVMARVRRELRGARGKEQDVEDVTQTVFLQIIKHLHKFKLDGRAQFSTWLFVITDRAAKTWKRDHKRDFERKQEYKLEQEAQPPPERSEAQVDLEARQLRARLKAPLDRLPKEQRQAFKLAYFKSLPLKEIAQIQGVAEGTVKSRLFRARRSIKEDVKRIMEGHEK